MVRVLGDRLRGPLRRFDVLLRDTLGARCGVETGAQKTTPAVPCGLLVS